MKTILILEDDRALSNGIALALKNEDIAILQCFDIAHAKRDFEKKAVDLLILDINLPDGNGLDFLCEVKKISNLPIVMLTANDLETDIVTGLERGADDYITKPFSLAVLRARVHTQLRKQEALSSNRFEQEGFVFEFETMGFWKNAIAIDLSKTEQRLLRVLIQNKGITLERSALVDRIWTDGAEYVDENALSVFSFRPW